MKPVRRVRLPLSFSLRTLLAAFTALALWLGYEMNWIHQRRAFLAQQFEHYVAAAPVPSQIDRREWVSAWWRGQRHRSSQAPWSLRPFGEKGLGGLAIIVPESNLTMRTWGDDA